MFTNSTMFFKYQTAKSLLYGQQIGWCNADVLYDEEKLPFLKKIVKLRYQYTNLFNSARMLRPPRVVTSIAPVVTGPTLKFTSSIAMEQVLGAAWRYREQSKTVIFLVNISDQEADFRLEFNLREYGLDAHDLPAEFHIEGDRCVVSGLLQATECRVWEL